MVGTLATITMRRACWARRAAYLGAGRQEEWQTYLASLLERHRRRYKLTPLLKALA
jgi:hypothetical protein